MHLAEPDLWVRHLMADREREAERARLAAAVAGRRRAAVRRLAGNTLVRLGSRVQAAGSRLVAEAASRPSADLACR